MGLWTNILIGYIIYRDSKEDGIRRLESRGIKFDRSDCRGYMAWAISFTILEVLSFVLFILDDRRLIRLPGDMDVFLLGMVFVLLFLCIITWFKYLDCILYFRRLRRHGYEVPEQKSLYDNDLNNLPRITDSICANERISGESALLALGSWLCFPWILISAIIFFLRYAGQGWWSIPPFMLLLIISGAWYVWGCMFWHQRLRTEFRDDVEIDDGRRLRRQFVSGFVAILVLMALSLMFVEVMYAFAGVVLRAREMQGLY